MGNTCVKSSSKVAVLSKSPSSVSTEMSVAGEFVAANDSEDLRGLRNLGRFFCPTNPLAFVIVDKRSGLVLLSATSTDQHLFTLSTPQGRSLGTLHVKETPLGWQFDLDQYSADADHAGALNVYSGLQLIAIIDTTVSILRGTDLVILYTLQTVQDLLLCNKSTVK